MDRLNKDDIAVMTIRCAKAVRDWMIEQGAMKNGYDSQANFTVFSNRETEIGKFQFPKNDSAWAHLKEHERNTRLKPLLEVFEEEMAELPVRTDHGSASGVNYCLKVAARTGDFCFHTSVTLQVVVQDLTLGADSRSVLPC